MKTFHHQPAISFSSKQLRHVFFFSWQQSVASFLEGAADTAYALVTLHYCCRFLGSLGSWRVVDRIDSTGVLQFPIKIMTTSREAMKMDRQLL